MAAFTKADRMLIRAKTVSSGTRQVFFMLAFIIFSLGQLDTLFEGEVPDSNGFQFYLEGEVKEHQSN